VQHSPNARVENRLRASAFAPRSERLGGAQRRDVVEVVTTEAELCCVSERGDEFTGLVAISTSGGQVGDPAVIVQAGGMTLRGRLGQSLLVVACRREVRDVAGRLVAAAGLEIGGGS
jgi:hypothetical protein